MLHLRTIAARERERESLIKISYDPICRVRELEVIYAGQKLDVAMAHAI